MTMKNDLHAAIGTLERRKHYLSECMKESNNPWAETNQTEIDALAVAISALRDVLQRQPDPDTGPEGSIRKREKMRSVKKETLDELARIIRKYWATGDKDILDAKYRKASELSEQAYGRAAKWSQFCDLIDGAVCINRNVSNDIIYKIFGLLCIEVSAPVEAGVVAGTARKLLPIGSECIGGDWEETAE